MRGRAFRFRRSRDTKDCIQCASQKKEDKDLPRLVLEREVCVAKNKQICIDIDSEEKVNKTLRLATNTVSSATSLEPLSQISSNNNEENRTTIHKEEESERERKENKH